MSLRSRTADDRAITQLAQYHAMAGLLTKWLPTLINAATARYSLDRKVE